MGETMIGRLIALIALGLTLAAGALACSGAGGARLSDSPTEALILLSDSAEPPLPPLMSSQLALTADSMARAAAEDTGPCPLGMAHIGRACIDRWEAHLVHDGGRHPHHQRPESGVSYRAMAAPGVMPQAYISRVEAEAACKNAGKRLCRWLEWRRACQGPGWRRYPYGHGGRRGKCNTGKQHLLRELFGNPPWDYEQFNSPKLNQTEGYLAPSGQYDECVSHDGVYDMNGNLHEWVADTVTEDFVAKMEEEEVDRVDQPWVVGNGMFLGGFYSTLDQHGPGCFFTTIAHEPTYHDYSTGFRCCRDAKRD